MMKVLPRCAFAAILLAALPVLAQEPDAGSADSGVAAGADAGVQEAAPLEPFVPPASSSPAQDGVPRDGAYEDEVQPGQEEPADTDPFAQGDMEPGLGIGGYGNGTDFYLGVSASFDYYVIARLAPGLEVQYTTIFSDYDYPDSITLLPFVKFVIMRSTRFAPYILVMGGREFQWGGSDNADAWIFGGGVGAFIGIADFSGVRFGIGVELRVLYYWYDKTKVYGYKDSLVKKDELGNEYLDSPPGCNVHLSCPVIPSDEKDKSSELFFPLISVGPAFLF
jgi:hypothetical protein